MSAIKANATILSEGPWVDLCIAINQAVRDEDGRTHCGIFCSCGGKLMFCAQAACRRKCAVGRGRCAGAASLTSAGRHCHRQGARCRLRPSRTPANSRGQSSVEPGFARNCVELPTRPHVGGRNSSPVPGIGPRG
jgi:hypothetical protein